MDLDTDPNTHTSVAQPYIDCDTRIYTNSHLVTDVIADTITHPDTGPHGDTNHHIYTRSFRHTNAHTHQFRNPHRYANWFALTIGYINGYTITHTNSHDYAHSIIDTNLDPSNYDDNKLNKLIDIKIPQGRYQPCGC
jgi:hypothetical protein